MTKALLFPANGTAAVSLFFVLSGLVLILSLNRATGQWPSIARSFIIRRIIRLYPPWIVSLAVVGLTIPLMVQFGPSLQASSWFRQHYQEPWTVETWLRNLCLASITLNPVGWTLQVELLSAVLIVSWWGIRRIFPSSMTDAALLIALAGWPHSGTAVLLLDSSSCRFTLAVSFPKSDGP